MANISSNANIEAVVMAEQSTDVDNPGAGYWKVYFKSDGIYIKDEDGTITGPLVDASSGPDFVGARYESNAGQTITNNAAAAIIDFEDQIYDTNSAVTTGASWKFTPPSTGYYHADVYLLMASSVAWSAGDRILFQIFKNGTYLNTLERIDWNNNTTSTSQMQAKGSITMALASSDYIDVRVAQNSGSDIALSTSAGQVWINIEKL